MIFALANLRNLDYSWVLFFISLRLCRSWCHRNIWQLTNKNYIKKRLNYQQKTKRLRLCSFSLGCILLNAYTSSNRAFFGSRQCCFFLSAKAVPLIPEFVKIWILTLTKLGFCCCYCNACHLMIEVYIFTFSLYGSLRAWWYHTDSE